VSAVGLINLTIYAEEVDRPELSLDVFEALLPVCKSSIRSGAVVLAHGTGHFQTLVAGFGPMSSA
jgi:hypothetical protein